MESLRISNAGSTKEVALAGASTWTIGRSTSNAIQVSDPFISAEHAELSRVADGWLIRKTLGSNPIVIDGRSCDEADLRPGSTFLIGQTTFQLLARTQGATSLLPGGTKHLDTRAILLPQSDEAPRPKTGSSAGELRSSSVALLEQFSGLLEKGTDRTGLARETLAVACKRMTATRGMIARRMEGDHLEVVGAVGFPDGASVAGLITQTVLREILANGQSVMVADTSLPDSGNTAQASVERNAIKAVACVPLLGAGGAVEGVAYLDNQDRPAEFTERDAEFLIWLGQVYRLLDENLAMRARLEAEVTRLKTAAAGVSLIAESPAMLALLDRLRRAADSDANILLLGETGAGKECLAHFVHTQSNLSGGPFVARNCAAIPEDLFESEMFGHVKGAFTGAAKDRKGAFREAEGGTIFLDEIGDLSYALQTKLLRAIQERTVRPVGADAEIPIRVRIVSATNRELRSAIRNRQFREDLYYRLATVTCVVPPLRERLKDIIPLARHFAKLLSGGTRWLSESAEEALRGQAWPGNVRELRASIEQAAIFASGSEIQPEDLALPTAAERISLAAGNRDGFVGTLADAERAHILRVLEVTGNNKNEAARVLQIARSTLTLKLKLYGL